MTDIPSSQTRREAVTIALATAGAAAIGPTDQAAAPNPAPTGGPHDFDFLVGRWTVRHQILKARLAGSAEWETCAGTTQLWPTMGGEGNMDDNVIERAAGAYRAMSIRAYDRKSRQWSIWWVDSRNPSASIEPAVRGGFKDGTGTFFADDALNGKPIKVRFIWSGITPTTAHWEQAYSPDDGGTWETNWEMAFTRAA